ncbi:MAG: hypothetical protein ACI9EF_002351, partial [Pseudohongiellaceae bacterium]
SWWPAGANPKATSGASACSEWPGESDRFGGGVALLACLFAWLSV